MPDRKALSMLLGLILVTTLVATPLAAAPSTWQVDPAHSHIGFSVRHFLTQIPGRFNDLSGTIVFDPDRPESSRVELTIDASSIDTNNEDRDRHLRSRDFFDVERFPTLSFKSNQVIDDDGVLMVAGNLKIRGRVENVVVPVEILGVIDTPDGPKAGFSATFHIDRKDYGIVWNQVLDQGTTVLGDVIKIRVDVEANPTAKP